MKYSEVFDAHKLNHIINNFDEIKKKYLKNTDENWNILTLLKAYSKSSTQTTIKNINKIEVHYNKTNDENIGRLYADNSKSLQSLPKEIRNTIAGQLYEDIDIKNCQPSILYQYAENNKLPFKNIKYYVDNREIIFKKLNKKYDLSNENIKLEFIKIINGGDGFKNYNDLPDYIVGFKNDVKAIQEYIYNNENEIYKNLAIENCKKKNNNNILGSVTNFFLTNIENKILQVMIKYLKQHKIINNNIVLIFDGFMILKEDLEKANITKEELLINLQNEIEEKTQYILKLVNKPMDNLIEIKINNGSSKSYESIKEEFEKTHFKINEPINYARIRQDGSIQRMSRQEIKDTYENLFFDGYNETNGNIKKCSFIARWLKDEHMRTYEKVDFLPMQEAPPNVYNTFHGYIASKLQKNKDVNFIESLIYKHIYEVICNNNIVVYDYFIKWLARLIKKPWQLTNTLLIIRSKQGAGKDLLFSWLFNKIFGIDYCVNTAKSELIFGKFNSEVENKILVVINEATNRDTSAIIEIIKDSVTNHFNTIEHKGMKPYRQTNNAGKVFLTNHDNAIKVTPDDRRIVGIECNNKYCNNGPYFTALIKEMNSGKYDRAFYDYLMSIECDDYDFTNNRPVTEFYSDMKEMNIPLIARFLADEIVKFKKTNSYFGSKLYNDFQEYIKRYNYKFEISYISFCIAIKKYTGISKIKSNNIKYIINHEELKQYLTKEYKMDFCNDDEEQHEEELPKAFEQKSKNDDVKQDETNNELEEELLNYESDSSSVHSKHYYINKSKDDDVDDDYK